MLEKTGAEQTFYIDPTYTEAITGQTHSVTGEELFFGVNAFDFLRDAVAVLQAGNSLFINGLSSDSITVPETVSLYLTDSAAPLLRIGQDSATASYSGDIVTVISGSTFGSENGWLVARCGTIDGDVSILIENSVLGSGWPIGRDTPQLRLVESCKFGANTETISVTIRDSVINEDISLLHDSVIGSKGDPATVTLTLERVNVPINKWFWITDCTTQGYSYADVVFNITDSTLGNSGTTALSVAYDQAAPDLFRGSVTYNIDGVYFSGVLYPTTTWSQTYPYTEHEGVYTANITGGSNRVEAVCGFDVVNIAAGATFFTDELSGTKTVNVAGELRASSIESGTTVRLLSGGTITGPVDLSGVTFATVESGSVVDFDIVDSRPSDTMSVRKLSVLNNIPEFELTVSPLLKHGTYTLATDAKSFDKTITVRNGEDGSVLGTIALDQPVEILGRSYELTMNYKYDLQLTIKGDDGASVKGHTVQPGRTLYLGGQTAEDTTVPRGGELRVIGTGVAIGTTVDFGGTMYLQQGGTASGVLVNSLGRLGIFTGGTATGIVENGGYVDIADKNATVAFASHSFSGLMLSRGAATIHSGTTAYDTKIGLDGAVQVFSGGIMYDTLIGSAGQLQVSSGGTANRAEVESGGKFYIASGGTANAATVNSGGSMIVGGSGRATGKMTFERDAVVSAEQGGVIDFDLTRTEAGEAALVNDLSVIQGAPLYTLTVDGTQGEGNYQLADGAAEFAGTISVVDTKGKALGAFAVGETVKVGNASYTLNLTDSVLSVAVAGPVLPPGDLVGTPDKVSWEAAGAEQYVVEYSTDNFEHVISVVTTGNAVDTPDLPAGTYQWRVKADGGEWAVGTAIVSENDPAAKVVPAVEDGSDDLFFATADGTWDNIYYARHVGSVNDWTGTNELVSANGKGRIRNLFFGSADPNVLCLTDGENGDAIFVDDVYTDLPEGVEAQTARLYRIQEIRAGAGDDIVDMTSQQFECAGDGLTIRGGDGNDTIWANKGNNTLFGDAGNDRIIGASKDDVIAGGIGSDSMHGGGGNDVFTFCDNWGTDTVLQLANGTVTLWFASGGMENWNAETLTYTDGENRVAVKGVAAGQITLKFGDDGSEQFAALSGIGAFDAFTSRKVFEESGTGFLASP